MIKIPHWRRLVFIDKVQDKNGSLPNEKVWGAAENLIPGCALEMFLLLASFLLEFMLNLIWVNLFFLAQFYQVTETNSSTQ